MPQSSASPAVALLARFPKRLRRHLAQLAVQHPRYCDLLVSFPAAAVALASPRRSQRQRAQALSLVEAGAPLHAIGAALGVPPWLRRWPPETLSQLPLRVGGVGDDLFFGAQIAGITADRLPREPSWLSQVLKARRRGGDLFAVWVARQLYHGVRFTDMALNGLAAFSYYSTHSETLAGRYADRRFHPRMSPVSAGTAAVDWFLTLLLVLKACSAPPCSFAGEIDGLHIAPLQTLADLRAEGRAMHNCLGNYGLKVLFDRVRLFSVRDASGPLVAFEVRPGLRGAHPPRVMQLKGPFNAPAPSAVAAGIAAWLGHANACPCLWLGPEPAIDPALWREVWHPYVSAHTSPRLFRAEAPEDLSQRLLQPLLRFTLAKEV